MTGGEATTNQFNQNQNSGSGTTIIFGDEGRHTRVGVGVNSLPLNVPVELDGVFEIA